MLGACSPSCSRLRGVARRRPRRAAATLRRSDRRARGLDAPVARRGAAERAGPPVRRRAGGRDPRASRTARLRAAPFLDIRGRVSSGGEQGLLSVAFHPSYAKNHRFYVDYTDRNGDTRVVEYRSNGDGAISRRRARQLLFVDQPYANHNGGQLAFGPDGLLYVGMGDGGSGGDPENRAQNLERAARQAAARSTSTHAARAGRSSALGLRNPWRFSFDRANGDLYIGDVGQGAWEEIDYTPRAQLRRSQNYGWDVYEGRATLRGQEPLGAGPARRARSPCTATTRAARSPAASSTAARRCPRCAAATSTATTAAARSGASASSGGKATDVRREAIRVAAR